MCYCCKHCKCQQCFGDFIIEKQFKLVKEITNRKLYCQLLLNHVHHKKRFAVNVRTFTEQTWTQNLEFLQPEKNPTIPTYRVMDVHGNILDPKQEPKLEDSFLVDLYKAMVKLSVTEKILYESQRQGRISFYMTSFGEEATQFGSAAALSNKDLVYAQYRETGVLLWRGFTIENIIDQCYGNDNDVAKGKQMPLHYGSKALHFVTISSPLATQMPQAVGSAYALKRAKESQCVAVYFGEGAASEGDAHAAFNFAAVLQAPIIFFCRNNGYAISTPAYEQYSGDGIASKGVGYGIATIRVDGNDILAVYNATKAAREYSLSDSRPTLIEAMTYRVGHHSTSDDSSAYRTEEEVKHWQEQNNPIYRFRKYLDGKQLWDNALQKDYEKQIRSEVMGALKKGEKTKKPAWIEMFKDVYSKAPSSLEKQKKYLTQHIQKFAEHYPLNSFKE
ncbi:branched chain keto acid dehydrogenase E1 subunit alpha isoform X2 [Rhodnius prolixus]|uniref:branched chain keto acid dehydrogenase E1 subunit alpha isoform X2 n=1 Tax=Rhodnius prolixus TaxID=13249 RepID=UPI003D18ACB9